MNQRLMAAKQFAKNQFSKLYNNAPIVQAFKQKSYKPLLTAIGNNPYFLGTSNLGRMGTMGKMGKMKVHPEDLAEMSDFTDYVAKQWKPKNFFKYEADVRDYLAPRYGVNPNQGNAGIRNAFTKILDINKFRR